MHETVTNTERLFCGSYDCCLSDGKESLYQINKNLFSLP